MSRKPTRSTRARGDDCARCVFADPACPRMPERRGPRVRPDGRRRASITRLYRSDGARRRTYGGGRIPEPLPQLRLSGNWLEEAGFGVGQPLAIEVGSGRLVIEAVAEGVA